MRSCTHRISSNTSPLKFALILALPYLLAGCCSCSAPQVEALVSNTSKVEISYRPFVVSIQVTGDISTAKTLATQLTAELVKVGTLDEDRAAMSPAARAALPENVPWLSVECHAGQNVERALKTLAEQRPYIALTPADVAWLKTLFKPEALDAKMNELAETLDALPAESAERRRLQHDPLDMLPHTREVLTQRLESRTPAFTTERSDGYFLAPNGTSLLILGQAVSLNSDAEFERAFSAACQRAKVRARANDGVVTQAVRVEELHVVVDAPDEDRVFAASAEVSARLQPYLASGEVATLPTVLDVIPSAAVQRENFQALRGFDFESAMKAFQASASKRFGTRGLVFFKPFLQRFEKFNLLTREAEPLTLKETLNGPLRADVAPYLNEKADGSVRRTIVLYPTTNADAAKLSADLSAALSPLSTAGVTMRVTAAPQ